MSEELQVKNPYKYCDSLTTYSRYKTRPVAIGKVAMGGDNPIRIQSMTTTDTMDTIGTVEQSIRIFEAGADYVRITAPSKKEAENLAEIKKELKSRGYDIPLIADIHFTPNAAEIAARIVEKVRVNPGNYADKKKFRLYEYTDEQYEEELERIRKKFTPLVNICKEEGTAMRVGTNHGSLSDRIMSRYGDTPMGMVESALEFVRICESLQYHDIVLSMKASNPRVMVQAYRLLVHQMEKEGMNYPLHLGVTEAGDGEDGRIKSAIGIGALLEDGLGDTIRVSLTEAPEAEVPEAIRLAERYKNRSGHAEIFPLMDFPKDPFAYQKLNVRQVENCGSDVVPIVIADGLNIKTAEDLSTLQYNYDADLDKWKIGDLAPDYIFTDSQTIDFALPGTLRVIQNAKAWQSEKKEKHFPLFTAKEFLESPDHSPTLNFVSIKIQDFLELDLEQLKNREDCILVLQTKNKHAMPEIRRMLFELLSNKFELPIVINYKYPKMDVEDLMLFASTDFGTPIIDGMCNGIWLQAETDMETVNGIAFGILQNTRARISKTEYISCPSCGRTLFDLEETTAQIRQRTDHLKGVKIGIMGCIVNGPGEMADADYGYVGSGVGKVTLYKGQEVQKRNISSENALDELIDLIKVNGDWVEREISN